MPHPEFQSNTYVDSVESTESLMNSASNIITDYIQRLQQEKQELLVFKENMLKHIQQLREFVWFEDIPSPTVPEYVEHHESITKILEYIDKVLLKDE